MTMETVESIVIIVGWMISLPWVYKICHDMRLYNEEVEKLNKRIEELQARLGDVEEDTNMNTFYICNMLKEMESN